MGHRYMAAFSELGPCRGRVVAEGWESGGMRGGVVGRDGICKYATAESRGVEKGVNCALCSATLEWLAGIRGGARRDGLNAWMRVRACMFEEGELTSPGIEVRAGDAAAGVACRGGLDRAWAKPLSTGGSALGRWRNGQGNL